MNNEMTQPKERPALFKGEMVNAILDGRKSQTRRIVKPQPTLSESTGFNWKGWAYGIGANHAGTVRNFAHKACPYGKPGDRIYVKETFFAWGLWETRFSKKKGRDEWHFIDMTKESGKEYLYAADGVENSDLPKDRSELRPRYWKRPSIFMPRSASRILLEITDIRVERLQDISYSDAEAEGMYGKYIKLQFSWQGTKRGYSTIDQFSDLWKSINGADSWDANPWVSVVEFKRVEPAVRSSYD